MKTLVFSPGKVGSLATYLGYFFLRFPGILGPEETWELEAFDTYDRRWCRQGRVWVRRGDQWFLVEPPALFALGDSVSLFGLQKPLRLDRFPVKVRTVEFRLGEQFIDGQVIRWRSRPFLTLQGSEGAGWDALVAALRADGLETVDPGSQGAALIRDAGRFTGPAAWTPTAPTDPGTPFLLDRLRDGWRMVRQYEAGTKEDVDTECLHQYRVYLRRARSLVSFGRQWERVPEWTRLKTVLRELQQRTNELRDLDVLLLDFPRLQSSLPWDEGPKLEGWFRAVQARRQGEQRRVKAWLGSDEHRRLAGEVDHLLTDLASLGEPWTAGELAVSAFIRGAKSLRRSLKVASPDAPDPALHEVRIEAKKIRYVLDSFGAFGPPAAVKVLTTVLKETQDHLGAFQDRCLLLERLKTERQALAKPSAVEFDVVTFGILIGGLAADQQNRRQLARKACRQLKTKTFLRALARLADLRPETTDGP